MTYRIDLLLPSERRGTGRVSKKFMLFAGSSVAAVILLSSVGWVMMESHKHKSRLSAVKNQWAQLDKVYKTVTAVQKETAKIKPMAGFADGWSKSRPPLGDILDAFQDVPPPTIQLTQMTLSEAYDKEGARTITLALQGVVSGDNPEEDVQRLSVGLKNSEPFDKLVESSRIVRYSAFDAKTGPSNRMVFDIMCKFKPAKITASTTKSKR